MTENTTAAPSTWESWAKIRINDAEDDYRRAHEALDQIDTDDPDLVEDAEENLRIRAEALDRARASYEFYKTSPQAQAGATVRGLVKAAGTEWAALAAKVAELDYQEAVHGRIDKTQAERDITLLTRLLNYANDELRSRGYPPRPVADVFAIKEG